MQVRVLPGPPSIARNDRRTGLPVRQCQGRAIKILFWGLSARRFREGFEAHLRIPHSIAVAAPDQDDAATREARAAAEVIVGGSVPPEVPNVRLFHVPGAGYDGVDLAALPAGTVVCNCFGHERGIAEYVIGVLLQRRLRLQQADRDLRRGVWRLGGGAPEQMRDELRGSSIGVLGYGHIGREVAHLARALEMSVTACSRRKVDDVDRWFEPARLAAFMGSADAIVVAVPLNAATRGLVDASALAAMRRDAVLVNVARGPVIDERALFDALSGKTIGGAVIDTWYAYPSVPGGTAPPSALPFAELDNIIMTPHMSGWTRQVVARRQKTIADNIQRLAHDDPLINVVHKVGAG